MQRSDVIVIGAGAIGASVAYHLAVRGLKVHVLEAEGIASGATGASEGLVGSIAKRKSGRVTDFVVKSFSMFPDLVGALGESIEYRRKPGLMVVDDEAHADLLKRFVDKRHSEGMSIEWLDRKDALASEPILNPAIIGAVQTPDQGSVNPMQLTYAYLREARRLGASITVPARVTGFEVRGQTVEKVKTTAGDFSAAIFVNAAGADASHVSALCGVRLDIVPKRAHMLVSEVQPRETLRNTIYVGANVAAGLDPEVLEFEDLPDDEHLRSAELANPWQLSSFTQTVNGSILFCGGFGFGGSSREANPETLATMMKNIAAVIPSFASLRIFRGWVGLEPCTPGNVPAAGFVSELENFVQAAGYGNAGVMMSPCAGLAIGEEIAGACLPMRRAPVDQAQSLMECR